MTEEAAVGRGAAARTFKKRLIRQIQASGAFIYVDTIISPSFKTAIAQIVQIPGISGLPNNTILLEFGGGDARLGWPASRSVLMGFVISLSSTAVVVSMLRDWGQLDSEAGHDAVGIILVQDLALVPMLLVLGLMSDQTAPGSVGVQVLGGVAMIGLVAFVLRRGTISLPFAKGLRSDHELQVFSAFVICFGFASLTALAQLSTALGAFVAGIVVASARETEWIHKSLDPLRVLLVALLFVSIGMLIDLGFLVDHWYVVGCVHCGAEILSLPCFGKSFQRLRVERAPADTETASQLLGCFEVSALFLLLWGVSNWGQCVFGP